MSDRVTVRIDCERDHVSSEVDQLHCLSLGGQLEETKSLLIMRVLEHEIKKLLMLSKNELRNLHLDNVLNY